MSSSSTSAEAGEGAGHTDPVGRDAAIRAAANGFPPDVPNGAGALRDLASTSALEARDARGEAERLVGPDHRARVLEPSPPSEGEPWFADDPVTDGPTDSPVVSPVPGAELTWEGWLAAYRPNDAAAADWVTARWLGRYHRLPVPPAGYAETRLALHRLAVYVISPARRRVTGKLALRWTLGGFGTPFFGADEQVRVVGTRLVHQRHAAAGPAAAVSEPVTSLGRASELVLGGPPELAWAEPFDVPAAGDLDEPLALDAAAATFLGDWFGFAVSVLEELRADRAALEPGRVQLWPEHFDAAFDCLPGIRRATFGASPGDAVEPEPYLYVVPSTPEAVAGRGEPADWNAADFTGAILSLRDVVDAPDQRGAALEFFRHRRALLAG